MAHAASSTPFPPLPTAAVADACVRLRLPVRAIPGLAPVIPGRTVAGGVLPVRHAGSVDVFLEALQAAEPGQVLVIDNGGRLDEGCIGDLTALEALHHGCAAIVVDGCHRDSAALRTLGLPVWSKGTFPFGPREARPRPADALLAANVGAGGGTRDDGVASVAGAGFGVTRDDVVALDDDGAVFVPGADAVRVWALARRIQETEADQARRAKQGEPLCAQFQVKQFLARRSAEPGLGFREHLRALGAAIEE